jgi:hypothetical protein
MKKKSISIIINIYMYYSIMTSGQDVFVSIIHTIANQVYDYGFYLLNRNVHNIFPQIVRPNTQQVVPQLTVTDSESSDYSDDDDY